MSLNFTFRVENARLILEKLMHVQITAVFDAPVAAVGGKPRVSDVFDTNKGGLR